MIRKTMLLVTLLLASSSAPAFAQDKPFFPLPLPFPNFEGTPEEQKACRPDVVRLCPDTVQDQNPDPQRILACLQRHRTGLKQPCRAVLENRGV
jgi:Cysteine rich repeat